MQQYRKKNQYVINRRIRDGITYSLGLINTNKKYKCEYYIGCSIKHLKKHIESQFVSGMNWKNRDEWHIDHITPIDYFVKNICNNYKIQPFKVQDNNYLLNYSWPGNVRELRNLIERVTILSLGKDQNRILNIIKESLTQSESDKFSINETLDYPLREARENFEKEYLITQLKKFSGNISKTARFVGMERSALHRKLKLLGVKDLN